MTAQRFLEFFSGVGLVRLGLAAAGWRCVFANDRDPVKADLFCYQPQIILGTARML